MTKIRVQNRVLRFCFINNKKDNFGRTSLKDILNANRQDEMQKKVNKLATSLPNNFRLSAKSLGS